MQTRIETLTEKKLAGKRIQMSFSNNKTFDLWRGFMPGIKEFHNRIGSDLYSIEIYPDGFFNKFNPEIPFEKWAAVEVKGFESLPNGIETMVLPGGLYAVFLYRGPASSAPQTYQYIFGTWLPQNREYLLDNRPHLALMGDKYKNEDPDSEEELWIPVKLISRVNRI
jgi:AraC family transcriptional regulator